MLVSSINFVNNYKFTDFIINKITEEQDEIQHQKQKEQKTSFMTSSSLNMCQDHCENIKEGAPNGCDCVTIETADGYFLTLDHSNLQVTLKRETEISQKCVFRRRRLSDEASRQRYVVFHSLLEPSYYLATSKERHLELQSYCPDSLTPGIRDERVFIVHETKDDTVFIQPFAHKGYYLHHIDQTMSVRQLDINFRPPEEFYMKVKEIPESIINSVLVEHPELPPQSKQETALTKQTFTKPTDPAPKVYRKYPKNRNDQQQSPITPKPSFLSCFGLKSKKKGKNKR